MTVRKRRPSVPAVCRRMPAVTGDELSRPAVCVYIITRSDHNVSGTARKKATKLAGRRHYIVTNANQSASSYVQACGTSTCPARVSVGYCLLCGPNILLVSHSKSYNILSSYRIGTVGAG